MPPLSDEKLRILTFPQRINGDKLDLHILLLPTQNLLNARTSFASELNPGTNVLLPKFISANLSLEIRTIKGLSTYPFSKPSALASEGATVDSQSTNLSFPGNLPILYEGLAARFKIDVSFWPARPSRKAPILPLQIAMGFVNTCRTPIAMRLTSPTCGPSLPRRMIVIIAR